MSHSCMSYKEHPFEGASNVWVTIDLQTHKDLYMHMVAEHTSKLEQKGYTTTANLHWDKLV